MILLGLVVMIASEAATLARIEPFWSWNTPIAWTGFILFADGSVGGGARRAGGAPRALLVVEPPARLDRLHPVRRRDGVAGAGPLVDPIGARRARLSGPPVDST